MASELGFWVFGTIVGAFLVYVAIRDLNKDYYVRQRLKWYRLDAERLRKKFDEAEALKQIEEGETYHPREFFIARGLISGFMFVLIGPMLVATEFDASKHLVPITLFLISIVCLASVAYINNRTPKLTPLAGTLLGVGLALLVSSFVL